MSGGGGGGGADSPSRVSVAQPGMTPQLQGQPLLGGPQSPRATPLGMARGGGTPSPARPQRAESPHQLPQSPHQLPQSPQRQSPRAKTAVAKAAL